MAQNAKKYVQQQNTMWLWDEWEILGTWENFLILKFLLVCCHNANMYIKQEHYKSNIKPTSYIHKIKLGLIKSSSILPRIIHPSHIEFAAIHWFNHLIWLNSRRTFLWLLANKFFIFRIDFLSFWHFG